MAANGPLSESESQSQSVWIGWQSSFIEFFREGLFFQGGGHIIFSHVRISSTSCVRAYLAKDSCGWQRGQVANADWLTDCMTWPITFRFFSNAVMLLIRYTIYYLLIYLRHSIQCWFYESMSLSLMIHCFDSIITSVRNVWCCPVQSNSVQSSQVVKNKLHWHGHGPWALSCSSWNWIMIFLFDSSSVMNCPHRPSVYRLPSTVYRLPSSTIIVFMNHTIQTRMAGKWHQPTIKSSCHTAARPRPPGPSFGLSVCSNRWAT